MNNKHLTFEERSIIEDLLNKGEKIHKIVQKVDRFVKLNAIYGFYPGI